MTTEELYAIPVNGDGWRVLPTGNYVRLGNDVSLGNYVSLGSGVSLGNYVSLGSGVSLVRTPIAVQGLKHIALVAEPGFIQIGCQRHSVEVWLSRYKAIAREQSYTEVETEQIGQIITFLSSEQFHAKEV